MGRNHLYALDLIERAASKVERQKQDAVKAQVSKGAGSTL